MWLLASLADLGRPDVGGNLARDASPLGDVGSLVWLRLPEAVQASAGRVVRLCWLWSDDGECLAARRTGASCCAERNPAFRTARSTRMRKRPR